MDTKKMLNDYVESRTAKLDSYPDIVRKGMDTIEGNIPFKLKLAVTLSELITFSSHLRKPIKLHDGTLVPTNAIVFALAGSGLSKDKALNAVRKSLRSGYLQIEDQRIGFARTKAESLARLEGDSPENWSNYYKAPKPLQSGLGTVEGLTHHFADISENPTGAGSIMSSEIGSELQNNGAMVDIIKTIAIAYDLGNIPAKIVKSHENQTSEIKGLPINAIFFGSHEALLYDNMIKNKFKLVFNTQLARRSIFTFTPEPPEKLHISSVEDLYEFKERERKRVRNAQEELNDLTSELVDNTTNEPLELSDDALKLFDVYLEYNSLTSDEMSNKFPIAKLSRRHKQWLALKLSGNYAILDGSETVTEEHYAYAINTVELLSQDLSNFETELIKEPYEQLADLCRASSENDEYVLTTHELRKLSYVTGNGSSKNKIEELCKLASSYDEEGSYFSSDNGITYKKLVKSDIVGVSYKIFDCDNLKGKPLKKYMSKESTDGYDFHETDFTDLENLLVENAVYSNFQFRDGVHSKDHLFGGTKFVILDIDKSVLTDAEAHTLLEEYNHFIVRTSDPENEFKFRVILELDSVVDVDPITWKAFIQELAEDLGLIVDPIPQSQIILSYKGRIILKQLEGKPIKAKDLLDKASVNIKDKPKPLRDLPKKDKENKLNDPRTTFSWAFEGDGEGRSNIMYRALALAIDLGADELYIRNLAKEINEYWTVPMEEHRLSRTLIEPALRRM